MQQQQKLKNKETLREDKEARDSGRLLRYNEYLKYPVYITMPDLSQELGATHESNGASKNSVAMKVEIVRTQLNIRKYVYGGAILPMGCMHSQL